LHVSGWAESLDVWVCLGLGYLAGSIPFGLLLTKAAGLGDIRSIGSGNIGATNVLRTGNKALAAATLLLDVLKGFVPVLLARHYVGIEAAAIAGAGAFLGHLFPVWLKFKGGKGVATAIGVIAAVAPWIALAACGIWIAVAAVTRYSSLAALVATGLTPFIALIMGRWDAVALGILLGTLIFVKHEANIRRLLKGEEPKIGGAKGP
jgi:acyl phosphate:glycerol-3-phosphate acyltransferase